MQRSRRTVRDQSRLIKVRWHCRSRAAFATASTSDMWPSSLVSVCGRQPCDAHHLRFAQNRAMGRKVSDEFTVPLCRGHHREVHRLATKPRGGGRQE